MVVDRIYQLNTQKTSFRMEIVTEMELDTDVTYVGVLKLSKISPKYICDS